MLEAEMDNHLGYAPYERTENPNARNGKKGKSIRSKYGEMDIDAPQDRWKFLWAPNSPRASEGYFGDRRKIIGIAIRFFAMLIHIPVPAFISRTADPVDLKFVKRNKWEKPRGSHSKRKHGYWVRFVSNSCPLPKKRTAIRQCAFLIGVGFERER